MRQATTAIPEEASPPAGLSADLGDFLQFVPQSGQFVPGLIPGPFFVLGYSQAKKKGSEYNG